MPGGHTGVRKRHDPDPGELLKTTDDETNLANTREVRARRGPYASGRWGAGWDAGGGASPVDEAALIFSRRHETALAAAEQAIAMAGDQMVGRVEHCAGQDAQDPQRAPGTTESLRHK